jgi:acetyl esterase
MASFEEWGSGGGTDEVVGGLHPQSESLLRRADALGLLDSFGVSISDFRKLERKELALKLEPVDVGSVEDVDVPTPSGPVPIRIYYPDGNRAFGALIYFHGGGWVAGSIELSDPECRYLANAAGAVVVSVGYRLAPENPFPRGLEDCVEVVRWASNAERLLRDGVQLPLAIGGSSAGGNLAAAVALYLRDHGGPAIELQVLLSPAIDFECNTPSHETFAEGYWLTSKDMKDVGALYLPDPTARANPYAAPIRADDLRGLPEALIITAECDVLRDEAEAYGRCLGRSGVQAKVCRFPGMLHAFYEYGRYVDSANSALDQVGAALRRTLSDACAA